MRIRYVLTPTACRLGYSFLSVHSDSKAACHAGLANQVPKHLRRRVGRLGGRGHGWHALISDYN